MTTVLAKKETRPPRPWFHRGPFHTLRDEVQDIFNQMVGDEIELPLFRMTPHVDLAETDQAVEVRMDAPGLDPKDFDIRVSGAALTITGERKEQREEKGKSWHRVECRTGAFSRTVMLPCPVKEEAVEAKYQDGVLRVTLPKTEEAKSRKIPVKT